MISAGIIIALLIVLAAYLYGLFVLIRAMAAILDGPYFD